MQEFKLLESKGSSTLRSSLK